jgi:integrase
LEFEALLRRRLALGEPLSPQQAPATTPPKQTFAAFAEDWFRIYVVVNNKPSEQRSKRFALNRHLLPAFGDSELSTIEPRHIEAFKAEKLQAGLAPKTVNNQLAVLGRCLRTAVEWGALNKCPMIRPLRKVVSERTDFLTPEESRALVGACAEPMWRNMLLVALRTGLRLGELFGLEWCDLDLDRRVLVVRQSIVRGIVGTPKSGKARYVPMTAEVILALSLVPHSAPLVFHRGNGQPLTYDLAKRAIRRACVAAGLRAVGWHTLRHTFASHLAVAGVPIISIQQLLGHASITMTMRYAHLAPSALQVAVESIAPLST